MKLLVRCIPFSLLAAAGFAPLLAAEATLWAPTPSAQIAADPISEMSGIVKSPGRDNTYWVHNDSGDSARIFAITAEGVSILPTYSKFTHYGDAPERGNQLWQGLPVLVAEISEIDPTASTRSAVIQRLPVVYPEQTEFPASVKHFDSESLFVFNNALYLITKHRGGGVMGTDFEPGANLYRLETRFTDQSNLLKKIDSHPEILGATGADLSPDGNTLAVISQDALWLFSRPQDGGDQWLSGLAKHYPFSRGALRQLEAVTWIDDATLLLGNEQRDLFRIPLSSLPSVLPLAVPAP